MLGGPDSAGFAFTPQWQLAMRYSSEPASPPPPSTTHPPPASLPLISPGPLLCPLPLLHPAPPRAAHGRFFTNFYLRPCTVATDHQRAYGSFAVAIGHVLA